MIVCPKHEGAYDCTPFCEVCEGEQEYTAPERYLQFPCMRCEKPATELYEGVCSPCMEGWWDDYLTSRVF